MKPKQIPAQTARPAGASTANTRTASSSSVDAPKSPGPINKKRILVVDDEINITRLLKLGLEKTDRFIVQTENRSEDAIRAAADFRPDLILLDIMMPGMAGDHVASLLRDSLMDHPVKIVFLTALASPTDRYHGPDRILSKPVNLNEVLKCLHEQLGA